MINIKFDNNTLQKAVELSHTIPSDIKNSIRDGEGTLVGFIGEILVSEYLGVNLQNTYDYDLVYRNVRIDVKSKEVGKNPKADPTPRPEYECSISAYNTKQQCHAYVFTRVDVGRQNAWILGWKGKNEYFEKYIFRHKGQIDPNSGRRQHTFPCDCYQMTIGELRSIESIKKFDSD